MHIRHPLALVAAAVLTAGAVGAQTLDQSVSDALRLDGPIMSQVTAQKSFATEENLNMVEIERAGPGGGQRGGGDRGGQRGGGDRGGQRGGDNRGGQDRGGDHRGGDRGGQDRGGDHRGGDRGGQDRGGDHRGGDRGGDHRIPDHRPDHRPDHDWDHYHGHPGWGNRYRGGWGWDPYGRPLWLGWIVWSGFGRGSCLEYYRDRNVSCHAQAGAEESACVQNCQVYAPGDSSCVNSCVTTSVYANESCEERYNEFWRTCPAF
ncbi:MAG: hypothetical protein ACHQ51_03225 [Elusimicrobiota bacterium]